MTLYARRCIHADKPKGQKSEKEIGRNRVQQQAGTVHISTTWNGRLLCGAPSRNMSSNRILDINQVTGTTCSKCRRISKVDKRLDLRYDLTHAFNKGDEVIDLNALKFGWPQVEGFVIGITTLNVRVRYSDGVSRNTTPKALVLKSEWLNVETK